MAASGRNRNRFWGIAVGAAATTVVCLLWATGRLDALNHAGDSLHFSTLSRMPADPRILIVDIDDHALDWVHPWPWPRRLHAELVRTLDELGARAIVLDIAFVDRAEPRIDPAGFAAHRDADRPREVLGDLADERVIYDDDELAAAIARAGNVYLATFFDSTSAGAGGNTAIEAAAVILEEHYDVDPVSLATRVGMELDNGDVAAARRRAAHRAARRFLEHSPDGDLPAFMATVLPDVSPDAFTAERAELLRALLAERSARLLAQRWSTVGPELLNRLRTGHDPALPIDKLAGAAHGVGFVNYEREAVDGTVRASPFLVQFRGQAVSSLGFLAACEAVGADFDTLTRRNGFFEITTGHGTLKIPLDDKGLTPINWHVPSPSRRWEDSFRHLPVTRIMEIAGSRRDIDRNRKRIGLQFAALVELRHAETGAEYDRYAALVRERNDDQARLLTARTVERIRILDDSIESLTRQIESMEREAIQWLAYQSALWENEQPQNHKEKVRREAIRQLDQQLSEQGTVASLRRINEKLRRRNAQRLTELRAEVDGRICFVGYTATAVPDFIPTPVCSSMPGVMAHANMANMVLQNRFARPAGGIVNLLLIAAGGLCITVLTCLRGPAFGLAAFVGVVAGVVVGTGLVFYLATVQTDWLSACLAVCVAWAAVTLYRQATEQREKRRFRQALAQYTSPAVAARIAERARYRDLAPQPTTVTCFFSDLKGFTRLSERLGPEKTRVVLNSHLKSMSAVLSDHGAIINKFIGDGIFAYFNAPIRPCENHAEQACASALASQETLRRLNDDPVILPPGEALVMRIGLSTGEVFVGDYGSDTKLDYTCIGDTVNLGSRLEAAGKILGTLILVDRPTRLAAGKRFAFRTIGRLRMPGMSAAIEVSVPIDTADRVNPAEGAFVRRFEEAIRCLQNRQWDQCLSLLDSCEAPRAGDRTVDFFRRAARRLRAHPPPDDWDGSVQLVAE
jgi:class 3 adenylate cyclase